MKALILNSGIGHRMGDITKTHPKCMTEIYGGQTIISRQLNQLVRAGVADTVMTTGPFVDILERHCADAEPQARISFVNNPKYAETNYIYSIYCARELLRDEDIILMHGDLVFDDRVFEKLLAFDGSCMTVSSTVPLPEKDFKAVIHNDHIDAVGIEFFTDALAAQPLYKLMKKDWNVWLDAICAFVDNGTVKCYAENALNTVSANCAIRPLDVKELLCNEIDNPEDLATVNGMLQAL